MSTVHSALLNWRAVMRISIAGWALATLASALAAWAWFSYTLPHHYLQAIPRAVLAHAMVMFGVQARTPWLMNFTPAGFLDRLAQVGIDVTPLLGVVKTLPMAGLGIVLAGWATYLSWRCNHD